VSAESFLSSKLSLFAYVAAMFAAKVNWGAALSGVLLPRITWSNEYFTALVAILGTTISPYLFFWQASQEAEDVHVDRRRKPLLKAPRQALDAFARIRTDTLLGMAFSNVIALAIIITTAATLHRAGVTNIETSTQAATHGSTSLSLRRTRPCIGGPARARN
jgi:Mn2+/Fe2+ NRAMP family transporter